MGNYGRAAILATRLINEGHAGSPQEAWEHAVGRIFPDSQSSREKGCPKGAFLGLCQEGFLIGVEPGAYTKSEKNKTYSVRAVTLLQTDPSLAGNENLLWEKSTDGGGIKPNSQMDVVVSLWAEGFIKSSPA